jgi:hypothetical protein
VKNRKWLILTIALLIAFDGGASAQKKKPKGVTIAPGESAQITWAMGTGTTSVVTPNYYWYRPKEDITPHEIALLLPLFSGTTYGQGQWGSREGAIVPNHGRSQGEWHGAGII